MDEAMSVGGDGRSGVVGRKTDNLVLLAVLFVVFISVAVEANGFRGQARAFPFWAGVAGATFVLIEAASVARLRLDDSGVPSLLTRARSIAPYVGWLIALLALIWLFGVPAAGAGFAAVFLWREASVRPHWAIVGGLAIMLFLVLTSDVLNLRWPTPWFDPLEAVGFEL